MSFAEAIKQIRCKSLLSQEAFAKMLGVSFTTVNRWETGKSKPSFKTLRIIDNLMLGCPHRVNVVDEDYSGVEPCLGEGGVDLVE